ncbi:MAG TPA: response regulator transcription factor [Ignavibacteria bacterium]|nr:response regulator transcription factor [Ignavibacteria bacterium]
MPEYTLNALIIDDEPAAVKNLEMLLKSFQEIQSVKGFTDPVKGFNTAMTINPDILFLDLQMPGLSGIEMIKKIEELNLHIHIVIVTAFEDLVVRAGHYGVIDHLLKPVLIEDLRKSILKYKIHKKNHGDGGKDSHFKKQLKRVRIPTSFEDFFFNPDDIFFLEADGNYTNIITPNGEKITSSYHLGKIQCFLPEDIFFRVSRKVIINYNYLYKIDKRKKLCILSSYNKKAQIAYSRTIISATGLMS